MAVPYITSKQYLQIFNQTMTFWRKWHKEYVSLMPEYERLLKRKREKKAYPLGKLPRNVLKDFPDIVFLKIKDWDDAEDYLLDLTYTELVALLADLENYEYNHARRSILSWIADAKYVLSHPKRNYPLAMNPDSRGLRNPMIRARHHYSIHDE